MTDLLFLTDVSQVDALGAEARRLGKRATIVTADTATAARLEHLGIPFIDEWELLSPDDLRANWLRSWELSGRWWEEALAGAGGDEFPSGDVARTELYWPFEWCLNARLIYDRLLDSLPVRAIYGYFLPPTPIIQSGPAPWERAITSLSHAVLRWCAGRRGLPVRRLKIARPLSCQQGPPNHGPLPTQDLGPLPAGCELPLHVNLVPGLPGHPVWIGDSGRRAGARPGVRTALVMQFLSGREAMDLETLFSRTPGWRLVRVSHPLTPDQGIAAWPWHDPETLRPYRAAKRAFDSARGRYAGDYPELFANPFLGYQFDRIWAEIFKAARLGESFRSVLKTVRASLVVFGYDGFVVERMLERIARSEGVPTVGLIHGGFTHHAGIRIRAGDADQMWVWGEEDARGLERYGVAAKSIRRVGSLRYGHIYQAARRKDRGSQTAAQLEARRSLGVSDRQPTIVLLTASTMALSAPLARPAAHRETWRQLAALASRRPDLTFIIKPHPGWDHYELYRVICREEPPNLRFLWDAKLDAVLAAADIAVLVNYCTTAALEAMLHGVPVVFLRTALYPAEASADSLQDGGAISVYDVGGLEAGLDRLIRDDDFRRDILASAEPFLASFLGGGEGTPYERLRRECERIALAPPGARDGGQGAWEFHQGLAQTLALLAESGRQQFLPAWKELVGVLASSPHSPALTAQTLFRLSYDIGLAADSPDELRSLVKCCYREARGPLSLPACEERNMLANAYVAGIAHRLRSGSGDQAAVLFRQALRESSRAVARLSRFPQVLQALSSALKEIHRNKDEARLLQGDPGGPGKREPSAGGWTGLRSSWIWKAGRLLVRPRSLLARALGRHGGRRSA